MKTISRYIMTLALLLTAVTGAWADEEPQLLTKIYASSSFLTGSQTFDDIATVTFGGTGTIAFNNGWIQNEYNKEATVTVTAVDGYTITSIKLYDVDSNNATISTSPFTAYLNKWGATYVTTGSGGAGDYVGDQVAKIEVYGYKSEPAITVDWNASTKTGTFEMPGSDVVLTPIYAPVAQWAEVETVKQLPAALEGVIADTDAPLIVEGTVAFAGTSTEVKQGTVMYAVTPATETEAPALDAANKWSADVPTAKLVADGGVDVLVWYYIKGADTPQDQTATAENTFNDSEICAEPIKVTVLSNRFDIQLNAANANTIEAGKATVTVGGTDKTATVTDGKLQGVKMGSEVKLKAADGYKFRKVEVKKKEATPLDNTSTAWADGAFAVPEGGMTYSRVINVSGNVTLTLPAGTTLTINGGINLECGATLTIEGEGAMQVNGTAGHNVDMAGSNHGAKADHGTDAIKGCETSKLIVNGGTVTAAGGNGGYVYTTDQPANMCDGGNGGAGISVALTVNGGTLTAIGGTGGTHANSWNGKDGTNGQGINSTFTAGTGISFSDSDNGTDWTANTGTSSTKQYVKAE